MVKPKRNAILFNTKTGSMIDFTKQRYFNYVVMGHYSISGGESYHPEEGIKCKEGKIYLYAPIRNLNVVIESPFVVTYQKDSVTTIWFVDFKDLREAIKRIQDGTFYPIDRTFNYQYFDNDLKPVSFELRIIGHGLGKGINYLNFVKMPESMKWEKPSFYQAPHLIHIIIGLVKINEKFVYLVPLNDHFIAKAVFDSDPLWEPKRFGAEGTIIPWSSPDKGWFLRYNQKTGKLKVLFAIKREDVYLDTSDEIIRDYLPKVISNVFGKIQFPDITWKDWYTSEKTFETLNTLMNQVIEKEINEARADFEVAAFDNLPKRCMIKLSKEEFYDVFGSDVPYKSKVTVNTIRNFVVTQGSKENLSRVQKVYGLLAKRYQEYLEIPKKK